MRRSANQSNTAFSVIVAMICLALLACRQSGGAVAATGGHTGDGTGGSTVGAGGRTIGGTQGNGAGGSSGGATSGTLVNPAPGSRPFVGANFWRIDWEGPDDFFQPNVNWANTTNPWLPQLLADLAPYKVLRFMDWNLTNDNPNAQSNWESRRQATQSQTSEPVAYEWQIDLCNRTLKDCWIAVPVQADANYHKNLAQLTHDKLDARLRLYVEYSNEVWNGSFPQSEIARATATQLNLPVEPNSCCEADTIRLGSGYVYGAVRMFEQFENVFGKGSPRLVKVLSGQAGWDGPCKVHMAALKNATINPNATMPTVYAIAPYFGGTTIAALQSAVAQTANVTKAHLSCASSLNLPLISYEGGSDSFSAAGDGCKTLQHDPGMYGLYGQYYDTLSAAGMQGPFMQYTHVGGCWGLKEKTSDTTSNSPKYRAVLDWVSAHP